MQRTRNQLSATHLQSESWGTKPTLSDSSALLTLQDKAPGLAPAPLGKDAGCCYRYLFRKETSGLLAHGPAPGADLVLAGAASTTLLLLLSPRLPLQLPSRSPTFSWDQQTQEKQLIRRPRVSPASSRKPLGITPGLRNLPFPLPLALRPGPLQPVAPFAAVLHAPACPRPDEFYRKFPPPPRSRPPLQVPPGTRAERPAQPSAPRQWRSVSQEASSL